MSDLLPFPQSLTEKYRPRTIDGFVGLQKAKAICRKLAAQPFPSAWRFVGPSGTGKTSLALALAESIPAELHHIASRDCDLETVRATVQACHWAPRMYSDWKPCPVHLILCDEADYMTVAAQRAWLSYLDATEPIPNTIVVFTMNSENGLEPKFLSRSRLVEFSSYGISAEVSALLQRIWDAETANSSRPNFARLVKEENNNVRGALMRLETEIMSAE